MPAVITNKPLNSTVDNIDFGRLVGELIDHRKLIVGLTSIFTVLAIIYVIFATPVFQAKALIQVEQKQGNAILDSLNQILPDSQPQSAPEIALLQSHMIMGKTVDDEDLQIDVSQNYFPLFGRGWSRLTGQEPGVLKVSNLFLPKKGSKDAQVILTVIDDTHYKIENSDGDEFTGTVGAELDEHGIFLKVDSMQADPGTRFTLKYLTRLKAINDLLDSFSAADQGKDTGMLSLSLTGTDPDRIVQILQSVSKNYLAQNIDRQAAQDEKSLEFLQVQLPKVRSDLDNAENKLNNYRRQKDTVDLSMEAKSALEQIVNADGQLNQLTFREAEISQLYTKDHPTYKALLEKRQTLLQEKEKLNQRVAAMPATQQEVLRLSRDVESGRAIYMMLLNRQQELSIAKSSAIGNVRIVDNAYAEPKAVKPKKVLLVLLGMIIGGVLSVGIVLLRALLRRGIEAPEQLEDLGIDIYASIPVSEWLIRKDQSRKSAKLGLKKNSGSFLAVDNPADVAVEAMRSLRTSLHFEMLDATNNVLMITGPIPNVGKTFISCNLAAVIAHTGKKVLFIDADMRRGNTHKLLQVACEHGLADYLAGKGSIESFIQPVHSAGFDIISRGVAPSNPAELLTGIRFAELISYASSHYDLVIIDTPPILPVTDAAIIGPYAGTTLLVARFEKNTSREIEISIKRLEKSGAIVKGCILNCVVRKASSYFSYGYTNYDYSYSTKKI